SRRAAMRGRVPGRVHRKRSRTSRVARTAVREIPGADARGAAMMRSRAVASIVLCYGLMLSAAAHADTPAKGSAAIASAHTLATEAGFEVIAQGGNAFDAAVAVAAAMSVVEPQSSGIGGGGLFLLHRVRDGSNV